MLPEVLVTHKLCAVGDGLQVLNRGRSLVIHIDFGLAESLRFLEEVRLHNGLQRNCSKTHLSIMTISRRSSTEKLLLAQHEASAELMPLTDYLISGSFFVLEEKKRERSIRNIEPKTQPVTKKTKQTTKKRTRFSKVEIREYSVVVGDQVGPTLPLSLGWSFNPDTIRMTVSTHEMRRWEIQNSLASRARGIAAFLPTPRRLTVKERIERLQEVSGCTDKELYEIEMERRRQHKTECLEFHRKCHLESA